MSPIYGSSAEARCKELQFQLDISRRMEKANIKLILEQYETIRRQTREIGMLQTKNINLEFMLSEETSLTKARISHSIEQATCIDSLTLKQTQAEKEIKKLKKKSDKLNIQLNATKAFLDYATMAFEILFEREQERQAAESNQIVIVGGGEDIESFPNDLLKEFSKLKVEPEPETYLEDQLFQKELARRIQCKICLSDVERLRCAECFKGICRGCCTKVKNCPVAVKGKSGNVVACKSVCIAFNTDKYCCRGANGTPATCNPSNWPKNYEAIFKKACPVAYSYAYDDKTSTFTCRGKNTISPSYKVTFC